MSLERIAECPSVTARPHAAPGLPLPAVTPRPTPLSRRAPPPSLQATPGCYCKPPAPTCHCKPPPPVVASHPPTCHCERSAAIPTRRQPTPTPSHPPRHRCDPHPAVAASHPPPVIASEARQSRPVSNQRQRRPTRAPAPPAAALSLRVTPHLSLQAKRGNPDP